VPDWVFQQAERSGEWSTSHPAHCSTGWRGEAIYPPEKAKAESERLFQEPTLVALRELAIRQTAQALEARAIAKKQARRIARGENPGERHRGTLDRHDVAARPSRGGLPSCRVCGGVCFARRANFPICPGPSDRPSSVIFTSPKICVSTRRSSLARTVRAGWWITRTRTGVTQIFLGLTVGTAGTLVPGLDFTDQVLYRARDLEVTVVAERSRKGGKPSLYPEDEAGGFNASRVRRHIPEITVGGLRSASFASTRDMSR